MERKAPSLTDSLVALGLLLLAIVSATASATTVVDATRPWDVWGYSLIALQIAPLTWRQRYPRLVVWASLLAWVTYVGLGYADTPAVFALFLALYGVAAYLPRRMAIAHGATILGLMLAWTVVGIMVTDRVGWASLVSVILGVTLPMMVGFADHRRSQRVTELELAAARQEQADRAASVEAVNSERSRIARELHDVVAHEMTVMTLQAEGARRMAGGTDPKLAEALATISDSGRKGLAEMQRMIAVLRTSEEGSRSEGANEAPWVGQDLAPMPSLAAIPALVKQVEEAGLPVRLSISGDAHVPAGVELSAYRIIQESLTNALKYGGPGARAAVVVRRSRDAVAIEVTDDGRGAAAEPPATRGGHGLVGMRERVEALGGTIDVGPRRGGGYRVNAVLPSSDDQVGVRTRGRSARAPSTARSAQP